MENKNAIVKVQQKKQPCIFNPYKDLFNFNFQNVK